MIFESLNDNVMLVELSCEEMKKYHITYETLDSDSPSTQSAVKNILTFIKANDKFNTSDKITVEALPVNDGGCFFIFTFSPKQKTRYKIKKTESTTVFSVDSINNLLDFVSVMKKLYRKNLEYEIYKMNKHFYMQIPENSQKINAVMREFGQISDIQPEKINEYGEFLGSVVI